MRTGEAKPPRRGRSQGGAIAKQSKTPLRTPPPGQPSQLATVPGLFGDSRTTSILADIFRNGYWTRPAGSTPPALLTRSGLVFPGRRDGQDVLVLSPRHPARREILDVLSVLNRDAPRGARSIAPIHAAEQLVDLERPLAHRSRYAFRLLLQLVRAGDDAVAIDSLRWTIPQPSSQAIHKLVATLSALDLVTEAGGLVSMASGVPASYYALIERLAEILAGRDPRLHRGVPPIVPRPAAFQCASDGAPRLFGSDIRLRNLMAVAKHGPMYAEEVLELTGGTSNKEGRDVAPFGRAGVVEVWPADGGAAVRLNPAHPLVYPLRRLLLALERQYPLPPLFRRHGMPIEPSPRRWVGDKLALFGGPICTSILLSIGVLGCTFEALCCATAIGYDRVVVKKALRTLHDEGILESERERRSGFDIRVVRLARSFAAREELETLLQLAVARWPEFGDRVQLAIDAMPEKTHTHLQNRQLTIRRRHAPNPSARGKAIGRLECLDRYYALCEDGGRIIPSYELARAAPGLYRAIVRVWGTFAAFRNDAALPDPLDAKSRERGQALAQQCIQEYFAVARKLGHLPNSTELMRTKYRVYERIRLQWGGFSHFCRSLDIHPSRHWRSAKQPKEQRRMQYQSEYLSLCEYIGRELSSAELRRHDLRLYRCISRAWPSFTVFRASLLDDRALHCVDLDAGNDA